MQESTAAGAFLASASQHLPCVSALRAQVPFGRDSTIAPYSGTTIVSQSSGPAVGG